MLHGIDGRGGASAHGSDGGGLDVHPVEDPGDVRRALQFQPGERVIVETSRDDVVTGEVVIDGGERIVRARMDESDLKHDLYVRRPLRSP